MATLGHALRTTTARRAKGAVSMMGGGNKAVLTASDFTFLGGFKLPDQVSGSPWADWAPGGDRYTNDASMGLAIRLVGGNPRLFAVSSSNKGGGIYEVSVPTLSTGSISTWNVASIVTAWGNIYDTYFYAVNSIRAVPSTTTLELQESQHWPDDWFNGMIIKFTSGTLSGQTRTITDHVGSTRVVTVNSSISGAAVNDTYILYHGTCQGSSSTTIVLDSSASSTNDAYKYWRVALVDGTNSGTNSWNYHRTIDSYDGATKTATLRTAWSQGNPVSGDTKYRLFTCHKVGEGGGADAGKWTMLGLDNGLGLQTSGLFWDETDQRLYHTHNHDYALTPHAPSFGFCKLDDTAKRPTPFGPWRFANSGEKYNRTGVVRIPQAFVDAYLGGTKTIGVGVGGYYSKFSDGSSGHSLGAVAPPPEVRNLPTDDEAVTTAYAALTDTRLMGHPTPGSKPNPPYPGRRNTNYRNRDPYGIWTGTVTSSTTTVTTFDGTAWWKENSSASGGGTAGYFDFDIRFTSGANNGLRRNISANSYDNKTITVSTAWPSAPQANDTFETYGGIAQGGTATTIILKSENTKNWTGGYIAIVGGTGSGQDERLVTAYNNTTKECTVTPAWTTTPDSTSVYTPYGNGFGTSEVWDPDPTVGYWTWLDFAHSVVWIENTNRHGVIMHRNGGESFVYYEHSAGYADGGYKAWWHIYDPFDFVPIIQGSAQQYTMVPAEIMADPGSQSQAIASEGRGAMCYDATNRRLYVMEQRGYFLGQSWFPVIRVYSVAD